MFDYVDKKMGINQAKDRGGVAGRLYCSLAKGNYGTDKELSKCLHAALNTSTMVAERAAENSVKLVHSLLRRRLRP